MSLVRIFIIVLIGVLTNITILYAQKVSISIWKDTAIGAIYNSKTKQVAYGKPDQKGNYKIYVSDSSGNNERLLQFSGWNTDRHHWPEEWHPSGEYLLTYIEKDEYVKEKKHRRKPVDATPGYGAYSDLWLIKSDGTKAWKLLDLPNSYESGIIHGAISKDGSVFAWSERVKAPRFGNFNMMAGAYVLKVADLILDSIPRLTNIRSFKPGNRDACNELDAISDDKQTVLFYSTFESKNLFATPIYSLNIFTKQIVKLTSESFAQAPTFTPDGEHIVYMIGAECDIFPLEIQGSDWWIMDRDGKNKRRLTFMNKKNHEHSVNHYRLAGCISFVDDHTFLGGVMTKPLGLVGLTVVVKWE